MKVTPNSHSAKFIISHRNLLWRVSLSELRTRYAGSLLGIGWAIFAPLMIIIIYALIYLVIFRVKVPSMDSMQYVLFIFSGLVPFLMTSEVLSIGVGSVVSNRSVLANTVFPVDLVPVKALLLGQVTMAVGMAVIILVSLFYGHLSWTMLLLPVIWLLHLMSLAGVVWFISLINLIFRDLQNMINIILMILMVASPIAYTADMVPANLKVIILLNPFAYYVIVYQNIMVLGTLPAWWNWLAVIALAIAPFFLGGLFFSRVKQAMIDHV